MKKIECDDEYLLWNAFLSVIDSLTIISQAHTLQLKDWKIWNKIDWSTFIHYLEEYLKIDNSIWDAIGLPTQWKEEYLFLFVELLNSQNKVNPILRSELQLDLELYND